MGGIDHKVCIDGKAMKDMFLAIALIHEILKGSHLGYRSLNIYHSFGCLKEDWEPFAFSIMGVQKGMQERGCHGEAAPAPESAGVRASTLYISPTERDLGLHCSSL